MDVARVFLTHAQAHQAGKAPFFFSRWIFQRAKRRGNTHFCFHCGGQWGFKPDKDGKPTQNKDDKITLYRTDGSDVKIKDALADPALEPHITDSPGYPRYYEGDREFTDWLGYTAHFDYSDQFEQWAIQNEYTIRRYDPMEKHDPVTHANGILGDMNKYQYAGDWFDNVEVPADFPFVVSLT